MTPWLDALQTTLRAEPEKWHPLGALVSSVAEQIPAHHAMRHYTRHTRRPCSGPLPTINSARYSLCCLRLRLFWIERKGVTRTKDWLPDDHIRLRVFGRCSCGGQRIASDRYNGGHLYALPPRLRCLSCNAITDREDKICPMEGASDAPIAGLATPPPPDWMQALFDGVAIS